MGILNAVLSIPRMILGLVTGLVVAVIVLQNASVVGPLITALIITPITAGVGWIGDLIGALIRLV